MDRINDDIKCSGFSTSEADAVVERSFVSLQANESPVCLKLPLEQVLMEFCMVLVPQVASFSNDLKNLIAIF